MLSECSGQNLYENIDRDFFKHEGLARARTVVARAGRHPSHALGFERRVSATVVRDNKRVSFSFSLFDTVERFVRWKSVLGKYEPLAPQSRELFFRTFEYFDASEN